MDLDEAAHCVFCSVRDGEDAVNHVLLRRDGVVALLNLSMITPGHTLVVPARHVERLDQLEAEEIGALWEVVREIRAAIAAALAPAGFVYVQNEGAEYVTEAHLHVHVVPRYPQDRLRDMWEERSVPDQAELQRVAALVASGLGP